MSYKTVHGKGAPLRARRALQGRRPEPCQPRAQRVCERRPGKLAQKPLPLPFRRGEGGVRGGFGDPQPSIIRFNCQRTNPVPQAEPGKIHQRHALKSNARHTAPTSRIALPILPLPLFEHILTLNTNEFFFLVQETIQHRTGSGYVVQKFAPFLQQPVASRDGGPARPEHVNRASILDKTANRTKACLYPYKSIRHWCPPGCWRCSPRSRAAAGWWWSGARS